VSKVVKRSNAHPCKPLFPGRPSSRLTSLVVFTYASEVADSNCSDHLVHTLCNDVFVTARKVVRPTLGLSSAGVGVPCLTEVLHFAISLAKYRSSVLRTFPGYNSWSPVEYETARRSSDDTEVDPGSFVAGRLSLDLMFADDMKFPFVSIPDCFYLTNILDSNIWPGFDLACGE